MGLSRLQSSNLVSYCRWMLILFQLCMRFRSVVGWLQRYCPHSQVVPFKKHHCFTLTTLANKLKIGHDIDDESIDSNNNNNNNNNNKKKYFAMPSLDSTKQILPRAQIVSTDRLQQCAERLRQGELVAFPTETVYGLGCHALQVDAIHKVFAAKERPLTDPLIVHVASADQALRLWSIPDHAVLHRLTQQFWPGPLTLVAPAVKAEENTMSRTTNTTNHVAVPSLLMAHTGYVACRVPQHALAQALLQEAGIPIAAPSANKFGHVSPTRAQHVYEDLKFEDVWILETDKEEDDCTVCQVGVESTVAKLMLRDDQSSVLTVLRQGAISVQQLEQSLIDAGLDQSCTVECHIRQTVPDHVAAVAPGQSIRHYSPNIPSYLIRSSCGAINNPTEDDRHALGTIVVIDYGGILSKWQSDALAYRDLTVRGNSDEAAQIIFETLRWAEQVPGGSKIVFPAIGDVIPIDPTNDDALLLAVQDRLTRAASGMTIDSLSR
jgi:L-threonylcarbamoyladenylate synthase